MKEERKKENKKRKKERRKRGKEEGIIIIIIIMIKNRKPQTTTAVLQVKQTSDICDFKIYIHIYFLENRDIIIVQAQSLVLMLLAAEIQCSHF